MTAQAHNIADLRELAKKRVPRGLFEFLDRGAEDEVALRTNRTVFDRARLVPRVLVDVAARSQEISLLGRTQKLPLVIAPTSTAGLVWYEGDLALARAAKAAGIPYTVSTESTNPIEEIAAQGARLWFQLYLWADVAMSHALVERVKAAGVEALVLTADSPVAGNREYNRRAQFTIPFTYRKRMLADLAARPEWTLSVLGRYLLHGGPRFGNYPAELDARLKANPKDRSMLKCEGQSWEHFRGLRKLWKGALIVKGVMCAEDARLAAENGADAIVVSNHGGRVLDSGLSPLEVLPEIADAVGDRITVIADSGFRRGSDVVKALALGAKAVMIGRATQYGVAAAGEAGASRALAILKEETDRVMAHIGCRTIADIGRACVRW